MADHVWNQPILHCKPLVIDFVMYAFVLYFWHARGLHTGPSYMYQYLATRNLHLGTIFAGSRRACNLVCTPYLDFGGNLFCQNRSINPGKPIRSHFHSNKIFQKIAPRLHVWEIFQAKVLHHWSINAHLKDWKWKETVLRNTQFSLWCQKKSSDR